MTDLDMRIVITKVLDPEELGAQIEPKMRNLGQALGARAQRLVPKRTFALHDTISAEVTRVGAKVKVSVGAGGPSSNGVNVDYALYVERGTSRMAAQPFLRPAMLQTAGRDFTYSGAGITTRGATSRRQRSRDRRIDRITDRGEGGS